MANVNPTQNLANKLRGSAAGITLGNQLFTGNVANLSALSVTQSIRSILSSFGYSLDKNLVIPLDAAQVIMAGGVFVNALDTAKDINAIAMPAGAALKGIATLGKDLGIMDENSSEILSLGGDLAMAVACGGYNILADIAVVLDVIADIGNFGNKVKADGYRNFSDYFNRYITPQKVASANIIANYQKGAINIFEAMGEIADAAPNLFLNYFPEMQGFIPEYLQTISYHTSETSWWGDHRSYDVSKQIIGIYNGHDVVEQGILEKFIIDPLKPFYNSSVMGKNKISMHALTLIALAVNQTGKTPLKTITPQWSAIPYLRKYRVTPYILGDEFLFQGTVADELASQNPVPYDNDFVHVPQNIQTGGFSVNGVQIYTEQQKSKQLERQIDIDLENKMLILDRNGDIEGLLKIPLAKKMLLNWGTPDLTKTGRMVVVEARDGTLQQIQTTDFKLNIQDYWQGVNLLRILKTTPYFVAGDINLNSFNYMGDLSEIQTKMAYFQNFWLAKSLNMLAYQNIARYLGTNADNITLRDYNNQGLGIFKVGK